MLYLPSVGRWVARASGVVSLLHAVQLCTYMLMPGVAILSRYAHAWSSHILPLRVGLVPGVACSRMPGNRGNGQHVACDQPAGTAVLPQARERQACTAGPQLAQCCGEPALHVFVCPTARPEFYISIAGVTIH